MPIHEDSNEHNTRLISRLTPPWAKSRAALVALATVAVLAVAGTTFGYAALSKSVTLSLDGRTEQVTAMGDTVGDVLDSEGIEVGPHDIVAPGLDEQVERRQPDLGEVRPPARPERRRQLAHLLGHLHQGGRRPR